ncbi:protein kinase subdomain-containing protein [Beauveria brongniartii RCEF 3172]|uniref:Protein kinase subdomain-containing protein n=1 Tax=Beauveria brongniartii RCEF 3172 TaxID=1081107 RepID=A0A166X2P5_9HYPO|nr:protein kinase subdomain-containing protein [Beauveria brongniartii RCEF 3172]
MEAMTRISAGSRLEQLPEHVLVSICEYLAEYEPTTKRSLCAFALALASQTYRNATDPQRFRRINIFIRGPQKLRRDMQRLRQTIQTGGRARFCRVIKIAGETISAEEEEQEEEAGYDPEQMCKRLWPGMVDRVDDEHPELLSGMDYPLCYYPALPSPSTQWPDEQPWQALVELCKELPQLEDVVFASTDQFPRALLSELHENHPQSRLHMRYFGLRSLIHPELEQRPAIHPDDIALATSPCLYSVVAVTSRYRYEQVVDYNKEAIMAMAAGLAPRLTNVCIIGATMQGSRTSMSTVPRPPWRGFPSSLVEAGPAEELLEWTRRTNFSQLQSLTLRPEVHSSTMEQLEDMDMRHAVAQLLETLPSLQSLTFHGPSEVTSLSTIISGQLATLRRLEILGTGEDRQGPGSSILSLVSADQLARQCPQLEELEVQVARAQGDARETAIYHCLGKLPRLKSLTLRLRIQRISPPGMHSGFVLMSFGDHWNMTVPEVQHRYREAAIDSKLALSIFNMIGRMNNLRALQLRPYGDYRGPFDGLGRWMCWLARRWIVKRDSAGNVMARELDAEKRKEALENLQEETNRKEWQTCKKAWDTLWPPRSAQWWDEWSSVPLKSGSEMDAILDDIEKRRAGSSIAAREESRVL